MIRITATIAIDEDEIEARFVRSPGPGGQKVNKTETAVQLRFDARACPTLPAPVFARLQKLAGRRMTKDGVIVITANRYRTQERNRRDALDRLIALLREAAVRPTPRRPTRPTPGAKERRLAGKRRTAGIKRDRSKPADC